jgi:RimJ/RimL family protein N-acetyltransferase
MPFQVAWTDGIGKPGFVEGFIGFHLGQREAWSPEKWSLELSVWAGGQSLGFQGVSAGRFASTRRVTTGSWLGERFQRRGYGTEMRRAVLALAFSSLGAEIAVSAYADGNRGSMRVSEKLGYAPAGEGWLEPRGVPVRHSRVELTAERWASLPRIPVEITGLDACLPLFGLA